MSLDPTFLKQLSIFAIGFSAAFLAALWLSLIFWTNRDIRKRSRDRVSRILSILLVTLLFLPGFLVYLVLRPPRTLEEEYQRALEEEALLQSIEEAAHCPGCERHIQADWLACPNCGTLLKKKCEFCERLLELPWNICPYCAAPAPVIAVEQKQAENEPEADLEQAYAVTGNIEDSEMDEDEEIQPELGEEESQT